MHAQSVTDMQRTSSRSEWTLPPYLVWAAAWFALFLFAANVRVGTALWDPVFRWVFVQATGLENLVGSSGRWATFGLVLGIYLVIGCVLWVAVENLAARKIRSAWARSGVAWASLQAIAMIFIFLAT